MKPVIALVLCLAVAATSLQVLSTKLPAVISPTTYFSDENNYQIDLPVETKVSSIPRGHRYADKNGATLLDIYIIPDNLMDERTLLSDETAKNIRENYHETFNVDEDAIKLSTINLDSNRSLKVDYSDNTSQSISRTDYYLTGSANTYIVSFYGDELGQKNTLASLKLL